MPCYERISARKGVAFEIEQRKEVGQKGVYPNSALTPCRSEGWLMRNKLLTPEYLRGIAFIFHRNRRNKTWDRRYAETVCNHSGKRVSTLPYDTFPAFSPQPSPTARFSPLYERCERKLIWLWPLASPLASSLAAVTNRIGFTLVWDRRSASGCSPPRLTTTQLPPAALPLLVSG